MSWRQTVRHPLVALDRKITEAQTCPGCGCNGDQWRDDCDCLRQGCSCAGAEQDDTAYWEREPGPDALIPDAAGGLDMPPAAEPYTPRKPPPDLHDLRRGRWYDEHPIKSTNTGSAGGAMASIEEVRAGIANANERANEGLGAIQQAHASLEQAQGQLLAATEGSGQADVNEANGLLAQAVGSLGEVQQQVSAAIQAAEDVAARL